MMLNRLGAFFAVAVTLTLSGCGGGGGGGVSKKDPLVYFVNASSDSNPVDFSMNDVVGASSFPFLKSSPDFISYPFIDDTQNGYDVSVRDSATLNEYDRASITFVQDSSNVVAISGLVNPAAGDQLKTLRLTTFGIDRTQPNGNKSRFLIFNAFQRKAGQMTPSIIFQTPGTNVQFASPAISSGSTTTLTVDSGTYNWIAKRSDGEAIYATANAQVAASGAIYLVIIGGAEAATGTSAPSITFIPIKPI